MTKAILTISAICLTALALSACQTPGLGELTAHLNDRGCATRGSATASAGITGASLGGNVEWECKPPAPASMRPGALVGGSEDPPV